MPLQNFELHAAILLFVPLSIPVNLARHHQIL